MLHDNTFVYYCLNGFENEHKKAVHLKCPNESMSHHLKLYDALVDLQTSHIFF